MFEPGTALQVLVSCGVELHAGLAMALHPGANSWQLLARISDKRGEPILGVSTRISHAGESTELVICGLCRGCRSGGPIKAGDQVMSDGKGSLVAFVEGKGYRAVGQALTDAFEGGLFAARIY